jgi:hypothetical protein
MQQMELFTTGDEIALAATCTDDQYWALFRVNPDAAAKVHVFRREASRLAMIKRQADMYRVRLAYLEAEREKRNFSRLWHS